ncbi:hypothetical protein TorRG33x02_309070, partial [Trema orientale]
EDEDDSQWSCGLGPWSVAVKLHHCGKSRDDPHKISGLGPWTVTMELHHHGAGDGRLEGMKERSRAEM